MAGVQLPLSVVLGAVDRFSGPLTKAGTKLDAFAAKAGKIGRALSVGITAPTAAFLGLSLRASIGLEKALAAVAATTNATSGELAALRRQATELGATPPFSAKEVAEAQRLLAKEGLKANEVLAATPAVLDLAAGHGLELATAIEITTRSIESFQRGAGDVPHVVDVISAAATRTGATVENLTRALDAISPVAAGLNLPLEDTVAFLGELDKKGIRGSRAGSSVAQALARVSAEGIEFESLTDLLEKFERVGGNADRTALAFGRTAGPVMAALLGDGVRSARELGRELAGGGGLGDAAARAGRATAGSGFALDRLGGALEKLQLAVASSGLLDWFALFADVGARVLGYLAEADPQLLAFATAAAAVAAAVGPVVLIVGQVASAISSVITVVKLAMPAIAAFNAILAANPILLVVLAVAALVTAIYFLWKHWDKVSGFLRASFELLTLPIRKFAAFILDAFPSLDSVIPDWIKGLITGKTFKVGAEGPPVAPQTIAAAANAGAPAPREAKVAVDFENVPRGVEVRRDSRSGTPVDLSVGYAMGGG